MSSWRICVVLSVLYIRIRSAGSLRPAYRRLFKSAVVEGGRSALIQTVSIQARPFGVCAARLSPSYYTKGINETMWEQIWDILLDTLLDGVKLLPFLFGAYLLIEWIEHHGSERFAAMLQKAGRFGPVAGAVLGCVPQCGSSVMASNFYAGRVITTGTLIAVFLSTSDEALPVLLAHPEHAGTVLMLLGVKVAIAIVVGLLVDLLRRRKTAGTEELHHQEMCAHCHCDDHGIFRSAVLHTLQVFGFILLVSLALNTAMELIGQDRLAVLLMADSFWQPIIAAVIGFIPNCAASVLLTELYVQGALSFGAAVAGLCTSAGVGLAVLWRMNRNWRDNLLLMGILFITGVVAGILVNWMF